MLAPVFKRDLSKNGFTLIELVVTIVVLGIGVSAIVGLMSVNTARGVNPLIDGRLMHVGKAYMDEIRHKRFAETMVPAPGCAINREEGSWPGFDDVDDYHGVDDSPPRTQTSTWMAQFSTVRVRVTVSCAGADIGLPQSGAKKITVLVTDSSGASQVYSVYRSLYD